MDTSSYPGDSGAIPIPERDSDQRRLKNKTLVLAQGALGVVYGDIGPSSLYALKECFHGHHAIALTEGNIESDYSHPFLKSLLARSGEWNRTSQRLKKLLFPIQAPPPMVPGRGEGRRSARGVGVHWSDQDQGITIAPKDEATIMDAIPFLMLICGFRRILISSKFQR